MNPPPNGIPRAAQLTTSPFPVTWTSSSHNFDGYVVFGVVLPSAYSQPTLFGAVVRQTMPRYIKCPVVNGQIDQTTGIPWNSDVDPPGTAWVAYWYDNSDNLINPQSGSAVAFSVGASAYTLVPPALPLPVGSNTPVPQP